MSVKRQVWQFEGHEIDLFDNLLSYTPCASKTTQKTLDCPVGVDSGYMSRNQQKKPVSSISKSVQRCFSGDKSQVLLHLILSLSLSLSLSLYIYRVKVQA